MRQTTISGNNFMYNQLISIAMCTYNGEKYIKEQLDSILTQTYTNIELIITDDKSIDNTIPIIKSYQKKDSRIKLYENKENLGFLKNFEKCISLCDGDYIALADQDDIWAKEKLQTFIHNIKDNMLIYSDAIIIDQYSSIVGHELIRSTKTLCKGSCNKALLLDNFVSGNTLMFRNSLKKYILPIHPNMTYHDSWIAFIAASYGTITYTQKALTYYRRYENQVTNTKKIKILNPIKKIIFKTERALSLAKIREQELKAFRSILPIKDTSTLYILDSLINHYSKYDKIYFNFSLYKVLKKYQKDIFTSFINTKQYSEMPAKFAKGLKFRTYTLFLL